MQRILERNSPQLQGADAEVWRELIRRDIPGWETKANEPERPEDWCELYNKLRAEMQEQVDKDAEALKAAMDGIKSERAKHTSKVVDPRSVPRLPRMGGMRAEGGRSAKAATTSSTLTFGAGSRTKTLTGKGVLNKAKKEAREMSLFSARKTILATPTHQLGSRASQVQSVPRGLVDEHKKPPGPAYANPNQGQRAPVTVFAPRKSMSRPAPATANATQAVMTNAEREDRLKAFTTQKPATAGMKRESTGAPVPSPSVSTSTPQRPSITSSENTPVRRETEYPSAGYKVPRLNLAATPGHGGRSRSGTPGSTPEKPRAKTAAADPLLRPNNVKRRRVS